MNPEKYGIKAQKGAGILGPEERYRLRTVIESNLVTADLSAS